MLRSDELPEARQRRREGASGAGRICGARVGSGLRECARAGARRRGQPASNSLLTLTRTEFEGNSGNPFAFSEDVKHLVQKH